MFLRSFTFPDNSMEFDFFLNIKRTCYDNYYPFKILSEVGLESIEFEPITILYGSNGSGKTTALNIIGNKLSLLRDSIYNKSSFYDEYLELCSYIHTGNSLHRSRVITSDDVFDYMFTIRYLNEGINLKREELFVEFLDRKYANFKFNSLEDYDALKLVNMSKSITQSKYIRKNLLDNIIGKSNGESAYEYFTSRIEGDGLFILDEPENSLSPKKQIELKFFIEESVKYFNCQFIISTHSPFLLSINQAKIYNLDSKPAKVEHWTDLENVKIYTEFFKNL